MHIYNFYGRYNVLTLFIYTSRKACFTLCYIDVSVRFDLLMLCSGHDLSYGFKLVPSKLV